MAGIILEMKYNTVMQNASLFTLQGTVIEGKKRGKGLGFPTANFFVKTDLPTGVFISYTVVDNKQYESLTFIGTAKTFNENEFQAETYLLNFNENLYGKTVIVKILKKLRDNLKFASKDELIAQMKKDKQEAEEYFSKNGN